jgi:hypothetical protein
MFEVTKLFIGGLLAGLTCTHKTRIRYPLGFECRHPIGGSPYRIIAIRRVS